MTTPSFPGTWYWVVGDTNPTTQVFESSSGTYVANTSANYLSWVLNGGQTSTFYQQPLVSGVADNGSGLVRVTAPTAKMTTNQVWAVQGVVITGATVVNGARAITVIDATHFDIQGSTFIGGDSWVSGGVVDRGAPIDTAANLTILLNTFGLSLVPTPGGFYRKNTITIVGNTTLSNPLSVANVVTANGPTLQLSLPPMNQPNSLPVGVPFTLTIDKASTGGITLFTYNDGVTQVGVFVLAAGMTVLMIVDSNSTVNGHVTIIGVFAENEVLPYVLGGTNAGGFTALGTVFETGGQLSAAAGSFGQQWQQIAGTTPGWVNLGTGHGDSNFAIPSNTEGFQIVFTNAVFTAARTWTLPAASACAPGTKIMVVDLQATVTAANTLSVPPHAGDTGPTTVLNHAGAWCCVVTDGVSKWSSVDATDASNLLLGTVPLARLPTIPASGVSGLAAIATSGSASDLTGGTVPSARQAAANLAASGNGGVTGTLPVANGGTGDTGTAWTPYTPVITAGTGTITTATATGRYKTIGKTVFVEMDIAITNNGTGNQSVNATLPVTAAAARYCLVGREVAVNGKSLAGNIAASATLTQIVFYDNTYPGGTGSNELALSGVYESV